MTPEERAEALKKYKAVQPKCPTCKPPELTEAEREIAAGRKYAPSFSVIIGSRNEGDRLKKTVECIRDTTERLDDVVVVDDASDTPEPYATYRLTQRLGVSGTRAVGLQASQSPVKLICDGHMEFPKGLLNSVADTAWVTGGIAYTCPQNYHSAGLKHIGGIFRCQWGPQVGEGIAQTSGMMGACYAARADVWERIGSWPRLPGFWGLCEETVSLVAARCGVPIYHVPGATQHYFKDASGTFEDVKWNAAAMMRLVFSDATWAEIRKGLPAMMWDGKPCGVSNDILNAVEQWYAKYNIPQFSVSEYGLLAMGWKR